ncbi:MAG: Fe-S cluster assembly protein HesB [Methanobacteriota archaeon]|nr:MAG: Fe-S cluster assembly protein HesB [Euryarchaeota archaeon]
MDYPWRKTTDPYRVMVSEIMLQQTQASRVIPKYLSFIKTFPTLESLAQASQLQVLRLWSGLGYNRRALHLQEAAKTLLDWGYFPDDPKELIRLKGIGPYTSRSIPIFAFNKDFGTVDTNIRRVFIVEGFATEATPQKELFQIADRLVPQGRSRDWHNALMDYGSKIVTARKSGIRSTGRQSPYEKSSRFFRGKILKLLLNRPQNLSDLCQMLEANERHLLPILQKMCAEGLISYQDGLYRVM